MINRFSFICVLLLLSCKSKVEKTRPVMAPISESVYASGIIKSKDQYQAYATVTGIVDSIYVKEGDAVKKGDPVLSISNEAQRLGKENAELAARYADFEANRGKLEDARLQVEFAKSKLMNDSALYARQSVLWDQRIGTRVELEQRELAFRNAKSAYYSALVKYDDLKRQLDFASSQAKKNLQISSRLERDFVLRSAIKGIVYNIFPAEGEIVGMQAPLAVIGDGSRFILDMQVDEYDILKVRKGLPVLVTLDSYRGEVFEATVTRINPMMNERSKTFTVEAEFTQQPEVLYPNITFEASIVINSKSEAMLVPREYVIHDSLVLTIGGDTITVKTGLRDYKKIEIISGLDAGAELIKPQ